jgi:coenzyme F420-0:L-glutamate ligase/coenzyme F420-1:gamma-L-glutamate ligase
MPGSRIELHGPSGVGEVHTGDDLAAIVIDALMTDGIGIRPGDVIAIAQKVVSKAEGRRVALDSVVPGQEARRLAAEADKDPRLVELILREATEVVRVVPGVLIVEHRSGLVLANAGIDQSNAGPQSGNEVILLPDDSDASAKALSRKFTAAAGGAVGVVVTDSIGRAWRLGTTGHAIGVAGFNALVDLRGTNDRNDRTMQVTEIGLADEIAAAASLVMGQAAESRPVVLVRGLATQAAEGSAAALLRPRDKDLFR